jgi:hypothetical protein
MSVVLMMGLGLVVIGLVPLWVGHARRARLLKTPRTPVAEVRPGSRVKVVGRLTVSRPVRAPASQAECAWYHLDVEQKLPSSVYARDSPAYVSSKETDQGEDLSIEDGSGRLALDLTEAFVSGARMRVCQSDNDSGDSLPTTFRERRLDVGVPVFALGRVEAGPQGPVLKGGHELELFEGLEKEHLTLKPGDFGYALLLVLGCMLTAAAAQTLLMDSEPVLAPPVTPSRPMGVQR